MQKKKSFGFAVFKFLFKVGAILGYLALIAILVLQALTPGTESSNISNTVGDKLDEIVTDVQKPEAEFYAVESVSFQSLTISDENLSEEELTLFIGDTGKINCEVLPANATNPALIFTSSDPEVLIVYPDGTFQALALGSTTLTICSVENSEISDTVTISVSEISLVSFEISNIPEEFRIGQTHKLEILYTPANTTQTGIVWKSSNTDVVAVNESGMLTAIAPGEARITATSQVNEEIVHSALITVLPPVIVPVEALTIHADHNVALIGDTIQLFVTIFPAEAKDSILWMSSDERIATVSQTGLVTFLKAGDVTVTAKCASYEVETSAEFTIKEVLSKTITLSTKNFTKNNDGNFSLDLGSSGTIVATLDKNATVLGVTFTSSNPEIAKVNANGVVEAIATGSVTITASTSYDGETTSASISFTVVDPTVYVEAVTLQEVGEVYIGASGTFVYAVLPEEATNRSVTIQSSNTKVVSVSSKNKWQAVGVGNAVITLTSLENPTISTSITIYVLDIPVTGIEISNVPEEFRVGQTHKLEIRYSPTNTSQKGVVWESSNTGVVTIDSTGKITAIAEGSAVITAKSKINDTLLVSVSVTVLPVYVPVYPPVENVTIQTNSTIAHIGERVQLSATLSPADSRDTLLWLSSDESVATVSQTGLVTFLKAGEVTITAKCTSYEKEASVRFIVKEILSKNITLLVENFNKINQTTYSVKAGVSGKVTPILDANATILEVLFTSSDPAVAKVNTNGVIETLEIGSVVITATTSYEGESTTASFTLNVLDPINRVEKVTMQNIGDVYIGESGTFNYSVLPDNATNPSVTFETSNPEVFQVYSDGKWQALGVGFAFVTLSSVENPAIQAVLTISVLDIPVTDIEISNLPEEFRIGQTHKLEIIYTPVNTTLKGIVWKSSNTDVLTVNESGMLTAINPGEATVTATSQANGEIVHSVEINVLPPQILPVESLTIQADSNIAYIKDIIQLSATIFPAEAKDSLVWMSSDEKIATITQTGGVTFLKAGVVTITAKCSSYQVETSIEFTVKEVLSKNITLTTKNFTVNSDGSLSLKIGSSGTITATLDENATILGITFTSSDPEIATISANGVVEAISKGSVVITVSTSYDGETTSTTILLNVENISFKDTISNFYYWVRKSFGHFGAFLVLGVFATITYYTIFSKSTKGKFIGFVVCIIAGFAVAGITEILQLPYFTTGRYCSFDDVLLDFDGYCTSSVIMYTAIFIAHFFMMAFNSVKRKIEKAKKRNLHLERVKMIKTQIMNAKKVKVKKLR